MWRSAVDPNSGRTYYWNTVTRETSWRLPADAALADDPPSSEGSDSSVAEPTDEVDASSSVADTDGVSSATAAGAMPFGMRTSNFFKQSASRCRQGAASVTGVFSKLRAGDSDEVPLPNAILNKGLYLSSMFAVAAVVL